MLRGLYTAATGMVGQQERLDTISNNLANVNTTGYKREDLISESFDEVLTLRINDISSIGNQSKEIGDMSLGLKASELYTDYSQGGFKDTGNPLNVALDGNGFFVAIKVDAEGNQSEIYTRDGSFQRTPSGFLTTSDGTLIQGENGPINLPSVNVDIQTDGKIYHNGEYIDTIKVVRFDTNSNLLKLGSNMYQTSGTEELLEFEGTVQQNRLEVSNVNTVKEMVELINVSRAYEANQKIIQTYDTSLEKTVNQVGRI